MKLIATFLLVSVALLIAALCLPKAPAIQGVCIMSAFGVVVLGMLWKVTR